jgi:hypothetical protein
MTGADAGGRNFWKPWSENAGEVTRKKVLSLEVNALPAFKPPRHMGPKIGGARDFRQTAPYLGNDTGVQRRGSKIDSKGTRSLDVQPGWRNYWSKVTTGQLDDWKGLLEVKVSDFCYECRERVDSCHRLQSEDYPTLWGSGRDRSATCDGCIRHKRKCLFMVSYRYHPDEDSDIGKVSDESMREHARNWQAAQRDSLTVATQTTTNSPLLSASLRSEAPRNDADKSNPAEQSMPYWEDYLPDRAPTPQDR